MAELRDWTFNDEVRAQPEEVAFDLARAAESVVMLRAEVPENAFTAGILGTERGGNGIVISEDGLVLTIGYLITEAEEVWLTTNAGKAISAYPLIYDFASGFGLVQAFGPLDVPALPRGSLASCGLDASVTILSHGGLPHALRAQVIGKREFAGYWEYVLDEALFTAPAHPEWSGAAVLNAAGELVALGSLLVQEEADGESRQGNMSVPIDLLQPVLEQTLSTGAAQRASRGWLGMYASEKDGQLVVMDVVAGGPAASAGVKSGDLVLQVGQQRVAKLAELFRAVWRLGPPGTVIPLGLAREGDPLNITVRSADRNDFLRKPLAH